MQYSRLLLFIFSPFIALSVQAQQREILPISSGAKKVIKTDTLIKESRVLAVNMPIAPTMLAPTSVIPKVKSVPLAGERSYYGNMTEYVNTYVRQYFGAHDKTLSVVKGRGKKQFPILENVLAKNHIPKELKYLAVIESALNNKAVSGVGAMGPWQLMDFTAREMGLTVNGKRDDRTDWYKSSSAACRYLNILYKQLDDWLLVVAAYNCGPVPVQRAIQKTGSRSFWDIKKFLPRETQGHVLAFIATATIFENLNPFIGQGGMPADFKFENEKAVVATKAGAPVKPAFTPEELARMSIVRIKEPIALELLSEKLGIDQKLLRKWNADYDLFVFNTYSEDYYGLRIPKDKLDVFIQNKLTLIKDSRLFFEDLN